MTGRRYAVLLGNGIFGDDQPQLRKLRCPSHDVTSLAELLASEAHGGYLVTTLIDGTHDSARKAVYQCLKKAAFGDLVLIYFSGHGKLDEDGNLYLVTKDTVVDVLPPTSFPVDDIRKYLAESAASRKVVILDCCFSGAIKRMYKGEVADQASQAIRDLEGQGTFYLTASTDIQLAEEKEGDEYSLLTKHILAGIRDGKADSNDDGTISFQELCSYVQAQVPKEGAQKPKAWFLEAEGDVTLALTGKPASDARRKAITRKLYELANQDLLTDEVVTSLLQIIKQDPAMQFSSDHTVKELIDSLHSKLGSVGSFLQEAVRYAEHPKRAPVSFAPSPIYVSGATTLPGNTAGAFQAPPISIENDTLFKTALTPPRLRRKYVLPIIGGAIFLLLVVVLVSRLRTSRESGSSQQTSYETHTAEYKPVKPEMPPPSETPTKSVKPTESPATGATVEGESRSPQRIRVSQGVTQGLLLRKIQPTYPPMARQARIQGSVLFEAIISKDGAVETLRVVSGHPMLIPAAMEAVKQWRYKPYILEGEPVEVDTKITVNFALSGG